MTNATYYPRVDENNLKPSSGTLTYNPEFHSGDFKEAVEALSDCIKQSLAIELPVMLNLATLPVGLASTGAHILGCSIRKGVKYKLDYDVNDSYITQVVILVVAGVTGGATKYGLRYVLTEEYVTADFLKTALYGALNNGLYELENLISAKFSSIKALSPIAIEGFEAFLKKTLKEGLTPGALVSLAGNFIYPNTEKIYESIKDTLLNPKEGNLHEILNATKVYEVFKVFKDTYLNQNDPIIGTLVNATLTFFTGESSNSTTDQDL